jgi:hypothetical protein
VISPELAGQTGDCAKSVPAGAIASAAVPSAVRLINCLRVSDVFLLELFIDLCFYFISQFPFYTD